MPTRVMGIERDGMWIVSFDDVPKTRIGNPLIDITVKTRLAINSSQEFLCVFIKRKQTLLSPSCGNNNKRHIERKNTI